ncbi:MAG: hypothetical protein ACKN9T_11165 [Candidatus Methylumidiphilus sp.]
MATDNLELPFEPNLDYLSRWLAGLPTGERERFARLFSGLQALNAAKPEPAFYCAALELFSAPVFKAGEALTAQFLGKPLPLEPGVRKLAKLSAQFHAELAQGYYAITQAARFREAFDLDSQGRIIHAALRSYNLMLLRLALMYESASSSIWLRLNELYHLAERNGLLGWAQACPELSHPAPCCVEELYVRMLAFRLAGPYRLGQAEIQQVFDIVQRNAHTVTLGREPATEQKRADFVVDLDSGGAPSSLSHEDGAPAGEGDLRYAFMEPLRKVFDALARPPLNRSSGFSAGLSNYVQVRLGGGGLGFLPGKKSRNSTVVAGYVNLVAAMSSGNEAQANIKLLALDEHDLLAARIELSKSSGTFNQPHPLAVQPFPALPDKTSSGFVCQVSPAHAPGFYVIESPGVPLPVANLLGLFTDGKLIQFGIICPGRNPNVPNDYGFELLAVQVSLVKVFYDASPRKAYPCFFSNMGEGRFSLITRPVRLRGGDGMAVRTQVLGPLERYRISRLLEKTAEFCQFEIVPEASVQT